MKIIVLDDREMALNNLANAISEVEPNAELHPFRRAEDALSFMQTTFCDVAFLRAEMAVPNGLSPAEQIQQLNSRLNIIFVTNCDSCRVQAFGLHVSGYLKEPVTARKIRNELDDLRYPVCSIRRVHIQTFGNFEVFLDGVPIHFQYSKTKELLAYLVDRRGAFCTNGEIATILFEDGKEHNVYIRRLIKDLTDTINTAGCSQMIIRSRGQLCIVPTEVTCDFFDWNTGKRQGYRGEYMAQYSWAEYTNAALSHSIW